MCLALHASGDVFASDRDVAAELNVALLKAYAGECVEVSTNKKKRTLVLLVGDERITFEVAKTAKITLDDREAKFRALRKGQIMEVTGEPGEEHYTATAVKARSKK